MTSRTKLAVFRLVLSLGSIFIALITIEVFLRIRFEEPEVQDNYWGRGAFEESAVAGFIHKPGFHGRAFRRNNFDCVIDISQEGLRQSDLDVQLKFPRRVLILGDSFAFGLGVQEDQMFSTLMKPRLNQSQLGIINGAQTGYCTEQEQKLGNQLISQFHPQFVLLCLFPDNDVEGSYLGDYKNVEVRYGVRLSNQRFFRGAVFDYLRTNTYLGLYLDRIVNKSKTRKVHASFKKLARSDLTKALQPTLNSLKGFHRECQSRGIQLAILLIPSDENGKMFRAPLIHLLKSEGIPFLDLQNAGFGLQDRFPADHHWNDSGHRKASSLTLPFLLELTGDGK